MGINTSDPKATLDIKAKIPSGTDTTPEGILIPRIDRIRAQSMLNIDLSTLIFVDNISTGTLAGNAVNIDSPGYYYFDGTVWRKQDSSLYNTNGTLIGNRIVAQNNNTLAFTGTVKNAFSVDGTTLSVDAAGHRVGIGTISPTQTLDIEGTARLSQKITSNTPNVLSNVQPLYISNSNGAITYAPKGFTTLSGGFRPSENSSSFLLASLPRTNTIVNVRFVCYVDESTDANNDNPLAYTYGDFTIIGTANANPAKIVGNSINIKGSDGNSKTSTNTDTSITWNNTPTTTISITLDQTTGELKLTGDINENSYMFEFLGGI
ncbi:hypothetical protein [Chryseobacterium sp. G0186]|uniref:hypothetical protein n=1 Tax=Chryseobacterium sp. G0186 TaxID=2487064 RepID=UPI000F4D8479|nr:hypothetical protein [Chryseobacterium sp. G0186]